MLLPKLVLPKVVILSQPAVAGEAKDLFLFRPTLTLSDEAHCNNFKASSWILPFVLNNVAV